MTERKADAGSDRVSRQARVRPVEKPENLLQLIPGYAGTIVANAERKPVLLIDVAVDIDTPGWRICRKLDRVVNEIDDDLQEPVLINK